MKPIPTSGGVEAAVGQILALLADRARDATICPSEVARRLAHESASQWREQMPVVHDAVDHAVARAEVELTWKGQRLARRSGPYRIGRGPHYGRVTIATADPNANR